MQAVQLHISASFTLKQSIAHTEQPNPVSNVQVSKIYTFVTHRWRCKGHILTRDTVWTGDLHQGQDSDDNSGRESNVSLHTFTTDQVQYTVTMLLRILLMPVTHLLALHKTSLKHIYPAFRYPYYHTI